MSGERPLTRLRVDARPNVARMEEYSGPVDPEQLARELGVPLERIVKLDANENPYGPTPRVAQALARFDQYQIYPDAEQRDLRRWIGEYVGLDPAYVLAGNGADELIDLLMRAYLDPGDQVVDFTPSFGMYAFTAQQYNAEVVAVERDACWEVDVERAVAAVGARTRLVLLTTPNNPTGNPASQELIRALLETGALVVVDEAYVEFSGLDSVAGWVPRHENLVVLRTFSKWAGLAGLRVGYGLLASPVGRHLWKLKPPFNVNQAAVVAVRETLADRAWLEENCRRIAAERDRLLAELPKLGYLRPYPSRSNFILCEVLGQDAVALKMALRQRGILIRHYTSPRISGCVRISVGTAEHSERLLEALKELRS